MPAIPLQYESLKDVLLYLDPNIRFRISLHMPSISPLERRLPLRIENLTFSKCSLKVNESTYQLGVYRDFGDNETPIDILETNEKGGASEDIDQYGVKIYPREGTVLPGDLDLRNGIRQALRTDTQEMKSIIVQHLGIYKRIRAERLNQEYEENDEFNVPQNYFLEDTVREKCLTDTIEQIESKIRSKQNELMPFINRQRDWKLKCTFWIQLTVKSTTSQQSQRGPYNKYLYKAEKALHTKLFGCRRSVITVKNLKMDMDYRILRFPVETKLKIENLEVSYWEASQFERLEKIIDTSSLPIQQLKLKSMLPFADFRHSIVKEAKSLVIDNGILREESWTPILMTLTNQKVTLANENRRFPPNNYAHLVEDWLERGRPVGTCFKMGMEFERTAKQCLDIQKGKHNVIGCSDKHVQLRMDDSLALNVSYEQIDQPGRFWRENQSRWWLSLKVVRARSE